MTSTSNQMITRCPKCSTAFRVTQNQLQSAKGAVRCGSCLNVFKAQDYAVAISEKAAPAPTQKPSEPAAPASKTSELKKPDLASLTRTPIKSDATQTPPRPIGALAGANNPRPLTPSTPKPLAQMTSKSVIDDGDDMLISDDMEEASATTDGYDFDSFMDLDLKPKAEMSLFDRKIRKAEDEDTPIKDADESWAEMLIDEDEEHPQLGIARPKTEEQLADDALTESHAAAPANTSTASSSTTTPNSAATPPGLLFSLVGEADAKTDDDLVLSDELAQIPNHSGFKPASDSTPQPDASLFENPEPTPSDEGPKRQVKTQPKIRSYDGSRAALLMNIIPAPIELTAKRVRSWYQRKLWPSLCVIALISLAAQIAWFKFDSLSRIEPYRTGYLFACPYLGCQVPTLVDTRQITTSNLVVREHPDTAGALAVDVMIINNAAFDQPFPDLMLVFTDINDQRVAARRFTPKDYLGGELVGRELMPRNQKVYITLDLVDPGAEAVNYHIYIPR